jgi:hypothetical protein
VLTVTPRDQVSTYILVGICACEEVQLPGACAVRVLDTCFFDYEGDSLVTRSRGGLRIKKLTGWDE